MQYTQNKRSIAFHLRKLNLSDKACCNFPFIFFKTKITFTPALFSSINKKTSAQASLRNFSIATASKNLDLLGKGGAK